VKLSQKIQTLIPYKNLLQGNLIGIEKESLRVSEKGCLSQTPHPPTLGSALTHPYITTDFSESLIELVTPPKPSAKEVLKFLDDTQHYLYCHLPKEQSFWPASMPCVIRGKTPIPIAQYGSSNIGKMKSIYRQGLANRYGSVMQTIAGIHFNYSFAEEFLQICQKTLPSGSNKNELYMALTRNVVRYGWIITYLFGASATVCKSFLQGYHQHSLVELNDSTLYEPYATSLRMGDIGYQNLAEDAVGVKANYNSLTHYIHSLQVGMQTACPGYKKIGIKKQGVYQQLNANILQIENEYYASVRPKPLPEKDKKPLNSLKSKGIGYVELRSIVINALFQLGINEEQIHFIEAFLLFCLLENSNMICTKEQFDIDNNDQLVAHEGRKPKLLLRHQHQTILLKDWGEDLIKRLYASAELLGPQHQKAVLEIGKRFKHPELTPAASMLLAMQTKQQNFSSYINELSQRYKQEYTYRTINTAHFAYLDKIGKDSYQQMRTIEAEDSLDFDTFLTQYFQS
jgi:glutamate--cysteine ligase